MTFSRFLGILSLIASAATAAAAVVNALSPKWAALLLGISAAINAFTERVQGGASKVADEGIILADKADKR